MLLQALGIKKVALLFLTSRRIAMERRWRLWLWDVAGMVPHQALPALEVAACSSGAAGESDADAWRRIQAACAPALEEPSGVAGPPLPPQFLYSLYVHAPPDSEGGPPGWRQPCCRSQVSARCACRSMHQQRQWLAMAPGALFHHLLHSPGGALRLALPLLQLLPRNRCSRTS